MNFLLVLYATIISIDIYILRSPLQWRYWLPFYEFLVVVALSILLMVFREGQDYTIFLRTSYITPQLDTPLNNNIYDHYVET